MTSQFDPKNDATKRKQILPDAESPSTCGPQPDVSNEDRSRRKFLQMAMGGAVAGLVTGAGMEFVAPSSALAQSLLTPEEALHELLEGNKRFVAVELTSFEQDLAILRNHTSDSTLVPSIHVPDVLCQGVVNGIGLAGVGRRHL
jgi:hypothetical protein